MSYSPSRSSQHSAGRRTSKSSIQSFNHSTPLRTSFSQQDTLDPTIFSSGGLAGNGGNLADELADAFYDDDEDYDAEDYVDDQGQAGDGVGTKGGRQAGVPDVQLDGRTGADRELVADSGIDVNSPIFRKNNRGSGGASLNPPSPHHKAHRRAGSEYDGSDYGSDSDMYASGLAPSLVSKIDAVESLARRGTESNGGPVDGVFARVADALRDLGSQSGVEGNATRLITAHSALTSHLAHQTRQLYNLTSPLLSPLAPSPDLETIDSLLPLLLSLCDAMPRPMTAAYSSLTALHSVTEDLIQTLDYLTDSLHMSRQTTAAATRRLRSAKELVADIRREDELREEGELFLSRGNWEERLRRRECAGVCGEVVGGFEEVCNGWRARLLDQVEEAPA